MKLKWLDASQLCCLFSPIVDPLCEPYKDVNILLLVGTQMLLLNVQCKLGYSMGHPPYY